MIGLKKIYTCCSNVLVINKILKRNIFSNECLLKKLSLWNQLSEENKINNNNEQSIRVSLSNFESEYKISNTLTPYAVVKTIDPEILNFSLISKVNGIPWDLNKILLTDCCIELLKFDDRLAKSAFWRSTAFLLNGIIENLFNAEIYCSDSNEKGFICDFILKDKSICSLDFISIEKEFNKYVNYKADFESIDVSIENLMELYSFSPAKLNYIETLRSNHNSVSLYKCAGFIDICTAPLIRNTEQLKYLKINGSCTVQMNPNDTQHSLQRIYGISFPSKELYDNWVLHQEEIAKRNHRVIGEEQQLFFFHSSSPGSAFMLSNGTHICNKLVDLIKEQYKKRGFLEVTTPQIFKNELWKTSGHWDHYQESLFKISLKSEEMYTLKPMNCPAHCLIFSHKSRRSEDLPLRLADFGALHRYEHSASLSGLTRLRKFHQDDAHIFCRYDQIEKEIEGTLDFLNHVYGILNFDYDLCLSTRPLEFLGDIEQWDLAEQQLKRSLDKFGKVWSLNAGDGAFYGPKIDISIKDAMDRFYQCATIQLDFQLPIKFDLKYWINQSTGCSERPVIIHRAILGSVERLLAILIESNGGKWPFWLNPRQILVVPVAPIFAKYATEVCEQIKAENFMCDVDLSNENLNNKILNGEKQRYNCILVVGQKELDNKKVNVRIRNRKGHGLWNLHELLIKFKDWAKYRTFDIEKEF